ncbi:macrolide family glycosyltransferase [Streptomyces sp. NPDC001530]|uniref:macrolide family glycosyltransferase n=1 Tax=Streptomyces sp. NPDC001530 TaxID=3364582 RepID=UPI00369FB039
MPKRFLFLCIPDRGHAYPNLAVVAELVRRGHQVTYLTGPSLAEAVAATGATLLPYETAYEKADVLHLATDEDPLALPILLAEESEAMIRAAEAHFGEDVPDLVAYDLATLHAGSILSRKWGRPAIRLSPVFASNEHFSAVQAMLEPDAEEVSAVPAGFEALMGKIAGMLEAHGVAMTVEEFSTGIEDFNLVPLPREFQFAGETFDERFAFVGPCLGDRSFLGTWKEPDDGLPVVLASLGTVFNQQPDFFRSCVEAFTDVPVHVVMTLGDGCDPADLGPLPANIEAHRWLPHRAVLEHARAFVTQGGMGSVVEALHAGCPMVAMPLAAVDRPTARRITELGLGQVLAPTDITPERLRDTVLGLIADEDTARRARTMRQHCLDAGGEVRAAEEIEQYLHRAGSGPGQKDTP